MVKNVVKGLAHYPRALKLIHQLALWKYFLIPGLVTLVLGLSILSFAWFGGGLLGDLIAPLLYFDLLINNSSIVASILIGIIGILLLKYLILIVAAPFMSPLSEKVENHLYGRPAISEKIEFKENLQLIFRGIRLSGRNFIRELVIVIFLLMISSIPIITLFSTTLIFLVHSFYAGFGNMDYFMERRFNFSDSVSFVKAHRGLALGNGIGFMLLLLIPFVGFFLAPPLSTVAATISAHEITNHWELEEEMV